MNSERELFEKAMFTKDFMFSPMWHDEDGEYFDLYTQQMWLSWQASAQREGFKFVPVDPTIDMVRRADDALLNPNSDTVDIYKAMIGEVNDDH